MRCWLGRRTGEAALTLRVEAENCSQANDGYALRGVGSLMEGPGMVVNRTTGTASVVPELVYEDVGAAVDWLCATFGFTEMWRAGDHRARLSFGNGVVIVADADPEYGRDVPGANGPQCHSVMVHVGDADAHHDHARSCGARILSPPRDYPYGERQYSAEDLGGHQWTFSQSIADVAPEDWGGTSATPSTASEAW
ncbi:MAG: VOC family protein [Streptosporangiales bacterium]